MDSPDGSPTTARRPWMVAVSIAFVVVLVVAAFLVGRSSDDDEGAGPDTTATTAPSTETTPTTPTTSEPTTTSTTTTTPVGIDTSTAVWPWAGSGTTYTDPVEAAVGFATDLVGFVDPIAGPFQQGDSRSGEVEIRAVESGPVTTVFVRQLSGSDDWYVLGSATANIEVTVPATGDAVTSPVRLEGTSTAFEANVSVAIFEDGSSTPLGSGFVMGGSMGELGPFEGELAFDDPDAAFGALVLTTDSMENGQVWEASVLRVRFP